MFAAKLKMTTRSAGRFSALGRRLAPAWLLLAVPAVLGQITISNVTVVNVTPSSFSVVWSASSVPPSLLTPVLAVFADAGGVSNLAEQVGLEYYPLNSGAPSATNAYQQRLSQDYLRQQTQILGLAQVRVSGLNPNTTYYYQAQESDAQGGQSVSPPSGPLPAVTTAQENGFVVQSLQLLISVPPINPPGSIITLSNPNTPSVLAAVVGDGAGSNQVYFSLSDIIAASGNTNFAPVGSVEFTANVLGTTEGTQPQTYSVLFNTNFTVGQGNQFSIGQYLSMSVGSTAALTGTGGSLPLGLVYGTGVTNLTFNLTLPTNAFSALSLQAVSPQLNSAALQPIGPNLVSVALGTAPGQSLQGAQTLAQLNFTVASNQPSAFVQIAAQSLRVLNSDGSQTSNALAQPGQLVIVGQQPLLQTRLGAGGTRSLALYGIPFDSYELQYATNLAHPIQWFDLMRVPMTNLVQVFGGLDTHPSTIFYRAYQFYANPPLLDISPAPAGGGPVSITTYGQTGTNYVLQYATNLSSSVVWHPLLSYTITNSFLTLTNIGNTNTAMFFRIMRP
jgi:hypothetical protein